MVQRFRNILVLYQGWLGDEATLDRAVALARDNGADLTLATLVQPWREPRRTILKPSPAEAALWLKALAAEKLRHLRRLAAGVTGGNFRIRCRTIDGTRPGEIRRLVDRKGIDLVVITADYASRLGAMAFGSLALECLRRVPVPVWLSPARGGEWTGRVLAAVNPQAGAELTALDIDILRTAAALARQRGAILDVLHAWELEGADLQTSRSEINDAIRTRLLGNATAVCERAVKRLCLAVDLDRLDAVIHLERGEPVDAIARFAADRAVEVIVMGAASRRGLGAALLRSPAERLIERVATPVLTLRAPAAALQKAVWRPPPLAHPA